MSDSFRCDIPGLSAWTARFKGADKIVSDELGKAGKRAGLAVQGLAQKYVPTDTKTLKRSITSTQAPFGTTVSAMGSVTKVGTNQPYGPTVEFGRRPGATPPPVAPIAEWLARKNSKLNPYAVARAIGKRGIPGRPFLFKAFNELKPQIQKEFAEVPRRVIARLRAG